MGWAQSRCDLAGVRPVPVTWGGASPVPVQMWQAWAQSRRRCWRGEPSPGADIGAVGPVPGQGRAPAGRCTPSTSRRRSPFSKRRVSEIGRRTLSRSNQGASLAPTCKPSQARQHAPYVQHAAGGAVLVAHSGMQPTRRAPIHVRHWRHCEVSLRPVALHNPREVLDVAEDDRHALLVPVACVRARARVLFCLRREPSPRTRSP